jgi:hypothetical protein
MMRSREKATCENIVAGNWKMNLTHSEDESDVDAFLAEIAEVDDSAFTSSVSRLAWCSFSLWSTCSLIPPRGPFASEASCSTVAGEPLFGKLHT